MTERKKDMPPQSQDDLANGQNQKHEAGQKAPTTITNACTEEQKGNTRAYPKDIAESLDYYAKSMLRKPAQEGLPDVDPCGVNCCAAPGLENNAQTFDPNAEKVQALSNQLEIATTVVKIATLSLDRTLFAAAKEEFKTVVSMIDELKDPKLDELRRQGLEEIYFIELQEQQVEKLNELGIQLATMIIAQDDEACIQQIDTAIENDRKKSSEIADRNDKQESLERAEGISKDRIGKGR